MSNFYAKNIAALAAKDAVAASLIDAVADPLNGEILQSRSGEPIVRLAGEDGVPRNVHSAYDPRREAADMISRLALKEKNVVIFCGFGLGYQVEELLEKCPWVHTVVIVEPHAPLFRKALESRDLSGVLASPKTLFLPGDDFSRYFNYLGAIQSRLLTGNIALERLPSLFDLLPGLYQKAHKHIADNIHLLSVNLNTILQKVKLCCSNTFELAPVTLHYPGVNRLAGIFKGRPAVCISSGPSLEKNIDLLSQLKGRAVLIAVDSVARVMLERGVAPDIVCAVDYSPEGVAKLQGLFEGLKDSSLIFDPEVCPASVTNFKGNIFVQETGGGLFQWLMSYNEPKGLLLKGMCNSHQAFSLAAYMGCDPIAFVGHDLSYQWDSKSHVAGTDFTAEKTLFTDPNTGKKYFIFTQKIMGVYALEVVMVPGIDGNEVPTDFALYSYLTWYKSAIPKVKATVIQASEQGAHIEGTQAMPLAAVMRRWCADSFDVRLTLSAAHSHRAPVQWEALRRDAEKSLRDLEEMHALSNEGSEIIAKILDVFLKGQNPDPAVQAMRNRSNALKDRIVALINTSIASPILQHVIGSNVFLVNRSESLPAGDLDANTMEYRLLERVSLFFEGIKGGTEFLCGKYRDFLQKFDEIREYKRNDDY